MAGIAAGLAAICYAEMASSVPVSGSTYSYAYATLGEIVAMGVAACLLLEYGVSTAAVAVGWSGYLNEALRNLTGIELPHAILAAPWDADPGVINLPAVVLVALCALLPAASPPGSTRYSDQAAPPPPAPQPRTPTHSRLAGRPNPRVTRRAA